MLWQSLGIRGFYYGFLKILLVKFICFPVSIYNLPGNIDGQSATMHRSSTGGGCYPCRVEDVAAQRIYFHMVGFTALV